MQASSKPVKVCTMLTGMCWDVQLVDNLGALKYVAALSADVMQELDDIMGYIPEQPGLR